MWIVDDSPLEAELVRRSLLPSYDAEAFVDGASFIEQFAGIARPEAIVLDWEMPGVSGREICQFLRSRRDTQAVPILVLTVHKNTADLVQCLAAGADDSAIRGSGVKPAFMVVIRREPSLTTRAGSGRSLAA